MLGRGALAQPRLPALIAEEMGLPVPERGLGYDWVSLLSRLSYYGHQQPEKLAKRTVFRLKQWLNMARRFGDFPHFDQLKTIQDEEELLRALELLGAGSTEVSGAA